MSWSRRIRNIAKSQINTLKERLDRIDAEAEVEEAERRARRDAQKELNDPTDIRPTLRTPEEIASGVKRPAAPPTSTPAPSKVEGGVREETTPLADPLSRHYRILGLEDGADFSAVEAAYAKLAARCAPDRFPAGTEEQKAAQEIFDRVDAAYNALRDALDPTAGRFDKLEL